MSKSAAAIVAEVADFPKDKLNHVKPEVKVVLPSADDVQKEKNDVDLMHEIEQPHHLKKVETVEKNSLPTKEDIEKEKQAGAK